HFELSSTDDSPDGHYKLRARHPFEADIEPIELTSPHQLADRGELALATPSTCGLIQLQLRIEYAKSTNLFRPSGIELRLSDGAEKVWQGAVRPVEFNQSFVTYVSPLPPENFHKVFGQGPVQSRKWNKIEYWTSPSDMLGSEAQRIRLEGFNCV